MKSLKPISFVSMFFVFLSVACEKESFRSGAQQVSTEKSFAFTCSSSQSSSSGEEEMTGRAGALGSVKGQFCIPGLDARPAETSYIVFTIDGSGSMKKADLGDGRTCKRRDAVDAVLKKLIDSGATDAIQVALVTFGSSASAVIGLEGITQFYARLSNSSAYDTFCPRSLGNTNYKAAFDTTKSILPSDQKDKTVLFFSDGLPEYPVGVFGDANADGLAAAQDLRALPKLSLKIAYLPVPNFKIDPTSYLHSLVEKPAEDVQVAANADAFVSAVQKLEISAASKLEGNSAIRAVLRASGFPDQNIPVTLKQLSEQVFDYQTAKFQLLGRVGETVVNELTVTAVGSDGKEVSSVSRIKYTQVK